MSQDISDSPGILRGPRGPQGFPLPTYLVPGSGQGYSARRVPWTSTISSQSLLFNPVGDLAGEAAADLELSAASIDGGVGLDPGHPGTVVLADRRRRLRGRPRRLDHRGRRPSQRRSDLAGEALVRALSVVDDVQRVDLGL